MFGLKSACVHAVVLSAVVGGAAISAAKADDVIRFGAPLPLTGPLAPEGDQAAAGLRPLGRAGQQGRRHLGRRQEVQGRDRLRRLSVQHAARGADHRADDHPGQRQLPVRRVRFGRRQGREHGLREIQGADASPPTASSSQVYDQGYKYLFGTFTPNDTLTTPLTQIVKAKAPDVKKVAILARNDLFPLAIAQEMEKSAKANGIEVVLFREICDQHARSFGDAVADQVARAAMDLRHRLHQRPAADPQADGRSADQGAGGHDDRRPGLSGLHRAAGQSAENITSASWWHPAEQYDGKDIFGTTAIS